MQQISSIWMAFAPSCSMLMFLPAAEFMVLWRCQNFQNEDHIICLPKLLLTTARRGAHSKLIVCSWDQINVLWKALVMKDSQHKSSKVTLSHTQLNYYLWCSAQQPALTKNHCLYMYKTPKCKIWFKPSLQTHTSHCGRDHLQCRHGGQGICWCKDLSVARNATVTITDPWWNITENYHHNSTVGFTKHEFLWTHLSTSRYVAVILNWHVRETTCFSFIIT
jgi:hypothetical protein